MSADDDSSTPPPSPGDSSPGGPSPSEDRGWQPRVAALEAQVRRLTDEVRALRADLRSGSASDVASGAARDVASEITLGAARDDAPGPASRPPSPSRGALPEGGPPDAASPVADAPEAEPGEAASTPTSDRPPSPRPSAPRPSPPEAEATDEASWTERLNLEASAETWIARVGAGLLLVGLAFLFKYSLDQGWIGPSVRVGFGACLGLGLGATGVRIYAERRRLSQLFLGVGSAVLYTTVFAAYQLYGMLAPVVALAAMICVTTLTLAFGLRQDEPLLGFVGTVGGLATPFLLYGETSSLPGFAAYVSILLGAVSAMYLARGWRSLLVAAAGGGWLSLLVACVDASFGTTPPVTDRASLQAALVVAFAALGLMPGAREVLRATHEAAWLHEAPTLSRSWLRRLTPARPAYGPVLSAPLLLLLCTDLLWNLSALAVGAGAATLGGGYVAGAVVLGRRGFGRLAAAASGASAILLATALAAWFDGPVRVVAWATEGAVLHLLARRTGDRTLRLAGHVLLAFVAVETVDVLVDTLAEVAFVSARGIGSALVVAALAVASVTLRTAVLRRGYYALAYGLLALWWGHELDALAHGTAWTMLAWGVQAMAVHALASRGAGLRRRLPWPEAPTGDARTLHALGVLTLVVTGASLVVTLLPFGVRPPEPVLVNAAALLRLATVAMAALAARFVPDVRLAGAYRVAAFVLLLGWWTHELAELEHALAYLALAWAAQGAAAQAVASGRAPSWLSGASEAERQTWHASAFLALVLGAAALVTTFVEDGATALRPVLVNAPARAQLLAVGALVGASRLGAERRLRTLYQLAAHALLLGWWWTQLAGLPSGQAYVSAAWGVTVLALFVLAVRLQRRDLYLAALVTLVLFVGKLFFVDLARLSALARILLFLGSGGVFLLLGYGLPGLLPRPPEDDDVEASGPEHDD